MTGNQIIYWDSCIFIAYLTNEQRDVSDQVGIRELVTQFDMGQIDLVTSTITITEVLECKIEDENYKLFKSLFSRKNFRLIDVTKRIAEISHEIRNYHIKEYSQNLKTPDCLHLATAIYTNCNSFYTFDGIANNNGLLNLHNPIAGKYQLPIIRPTPNSRQLSLLP
jgi:predicted nucleic acid-binding protein